MSSPIALPMPWLRSLSDAFLPDLLDIARYTETSTADGVTQDWTTIVTGVRCRVSPRASTGNEALGPGGAVVRALSPWTVWVPFGTDVTVRDRVTVTGSDRPDGRTFEVARIGERSYEASRELLCELVE